MNEDIEKFKKEMFENDNSTLNRLTKTLIGAYKNFWEKEDSCDGFELSSINGIAIAKLLAMNSAIFIKSGLDDQIINEYNNHILMMAIQFIPYALECIHD